MTEKCTNPKCGAPISRDDTKYVFKKDRFIHILCMDYYFNHTRQQKKGD